MTTAASIELTLDHVLERIHQMYALVDHRRSVETVDLCAADFAMQAGPMVFERAQYVELMSGRMNAPYRTRHTVQNPRLTARTDDEVTVEFVSVVHRLDDGEDFPWTIIGDVVDVWRHEGGQTLLARRTMSLFADGRPLDRRGL